ncbi:MAG: tetratricopeptide repeat protein [Candidatus Puniceispirillaceae bacterium]
MADIFDEINEELKQDRMTALWQRYGKYVIAFVIAVVAGVSLTQGYSYYTQKRDARSADMFFNAILSDDVSVALEVAKEELSDGYVLLAEFRLAAALAENDQVAEAEQHYLSIAARDDIQQIYRDIALLLSVMQAPESTQVSDLQTRLDPLISSVSPLKGLALEQAAALDVRRGNKAAAIKKLNELVALTDIPASLRQRAAQILTVLDNS